MNNEPTQNFPVKDWELLPLEVLKCTYGEGKEYFQSQLDETTSVTSKTIQFGLGFLSFLFGVSLLVFVKHPMTCFHFLLYGLSVADILIACKILLGRKGHEQGLRAENILSIDFDNHTLFDDKEKEKLTYYNMIKGYDIKIVEIIIDNHKRAKWYNAFLIVTVSLLFLISVYALVISAHP